MVLRFLIHEYQITMFIFLFIFSQGCVQFNEHATISENIFLISMLHSSLLRQILVRNNSEKKIPILSHSLSVSRALLLSLR